MRKGSHEKVERESWERRTNIRTVGTWGISIGVAAELAAGLAAELAAGRVVF